MPPSDFHMMSEFCKMAFIIEFLERELRDQTITVNDLIKANDSKSTASAAYSESQLQAAITLLKSYAKDRTFE